MELWFASQLGRVLSSILPSINGLNGFNDHSSLTTCMQEGKLCPNWQLSKRKKLFMLSQESRSSELRTRNQIKHKNKLWQSYSQCVSYGCYLLSLCSNAIYFQNLWNGVANFKEKVMVISSIWLVWNLSYLSCVSQNETKSDSEI